MKCSTCGHFNRCPACMGNICTACGSELIYPYRYPIKPKRATEETRNPLNLQSWRRESNPQPADYKSAALPLSYASKVLQMLVPQGFGKINRLAEAGKKGAKLSFERDRGSS